MVNPPVQEASDVFLWEYVSVNCKASFDIFLLEDIKYFKCTYGWHSLIRSWSVVPGGRPRMYRLVLLNCSPLLLLLLLLLLFVLGLGGAMGWGAGA